MFAWGIRESFVQILAHEFTSLAGLLSNSVADSTCKPTKQSRLLYQRTKHATPKMGDVCKTAATSNFVGCECSCTELQAAKFFICIFISTCHMNILQSYSHFRISFLPALLSRYWFQRKIPFLQYIEYFPILSFLWKNRPLGSLLHGIKPVIFHARLSTEIYAFTALALRNHNVTKTQQENIQLRWQKCRSVRLVWAVLGVLLYQLTKFGAK